MHCNCVSGCELACREPVAGETEENWRQTGGESWGLQTGETFAGFTGVWVCVSAGAWCSGECICDKAELKCHRILYMCARTGTVFIYITERVLVMYGVYKIFKFYLAGETGSPLLAKDMSICSSWSTQRGVAKVLKMVGQIREWLHAKFLARKPHPLIKVTFK